MKLPWYVWLVLAVVLCGLLWLAVRQWGLIGTALIPAVVVAAGVNEVAKQAGAKPMKPPDNGKPRRPGPSGVSPKPIDGQKPARSRRNRGRY